MFPLLCKHGTVKELSILILERHGVAVALVQNALGNHVLNQQANGRALLQLLVKHVAELFHVDSIQVSHFLSRTTNQVQVRVLGTHAVSAQLSDQSFHLVLCHTTADRNLHCMSSSAVGDMSASVHHSATSRAGLKGASLAVVSQIVSAHVGVGVHLRHEVVGSLVADIRS